MIVQAPHAILHCDGSSLPTNPGFGGAGYVLSVDGTVLAAAGVYLGAGLSNNAAEFNGLLAGLESAMKHGIEDIEVHLDSRLVVQLVNDRWRTKKPHLQGYHTRACNLLSHFKHWTVEWRGREENTQADALANAAATERRNVTPADVRGKDYTQRVRSALSGYFRDRRPRGRHRRAVQA